MGATGPASAYLRVEWAPAPASTVTLGCGRLGDMVVRSVQGPSPGVRAAGGARACEGALARLGWVVSATLPHLGVRVGPRRKALSRPAGGARVCISGSLGQAWPPLGGRAEGQDPRSQERPWPTLMKD